jgi:glycosyltransferase involved in cell wall biosynthesis
MKLIINTTTLSGTGVTQVAFSFIQECKSHLHNTYHIFLSPTLSKEIDKTSFPSNFYFYDFKGHPLYGLKGFFIRKKLKNLEKKINPDVVFTVFGPACWTPRSPHITGFANSYYVYPESPFYKVIPWKEKMRIQLMKWAHRFFLKRNGQYFICETQDMSQRLVKFLNINSNNVFTVSNTFNHFFENPNTENLPVLLPKRREGEFRIVSLASLDIHKNLTVINDVVPILEKKLPGNKVKFVLTVDENKFQTQFNTLAKSKIVNLGRIPVKFCPQLYVESDVLFLPSLIESFSANYPEAMKMKKQQ